MKELKSTPTERGEKKSVCMIVYPFKTYVVSMICSADDMTCFFKRSILNLALSVFFSVLKKEPFHFSRALHVIILTEQFAMIFSTESEVGE